jgi:2-dehydro-3-deoxyphosphogluconate aldolase / (4S)-4-hydroxy-2-oxoglutarate aldolase
MSTDLDLKAITSGRIVPVVVLKEADDAVPLAEALLAGGLNVIEITFRTPAAEPAVRRIVERLPQMIVGAGTLLEAAQVERAKGAGAAFGVAPGLNPRILEVAKRVGLPFMPGVMTPSEVEAAIELGCRILKFFPANLAGGVAMLKALTGPYANTGARFVVLGGVTPANMREFLDLPIVAAVGGSWIVDPQLIAAKNWSEITRRTREAVEIAGSAS